MKKNRKGIGIEGSLPSGKCDDKKCPFHGALKVRGRTFFGRVISAKAQKTVRIEFPRLYPLPKYERFERRRTRIQAHNPSCINAVEGDNVKIMECRPLSKTKNFVVIDVMKE